MEGQAGRKTQATLPPSPTSGPVLYGVGCLYIRSGTSLILFMVDTVKRTSHDKIRFDVRPSSVVFHILASPKYLPCQPCQHMPNKLGRRLID